MLKEVVYVKSFSLHESGAKDSFQTIMARQANGMVFFNSRWRKIHSKGISRYIIVDGLEFSIV